MHINGQCIVNANTAGDEQLVICTGKKVGNMEHSQFMKEFENAVRDKAVLHMMAIDCDAQGLKEPKGKQPRAK
eukprot:4692576-Karenia_brevis.AAC.1